MRLRLNRAQTRARPFQHTAVDDDNDANNARAFHELARNAQRRHAAARPAHSTLCWAPPLKQCGSFQQNSFNRAANRPCVFALLFPSSNALVESTTRHGVVESQNFSSSSPSTFAALSNAQKKLHTSQRVCLCARVCVCFVGFVSRGVFCARARACQVSRL